MAIVFLIDDDVIGLFLTSSRTGGQKENVL